MVKVLGDWKLFMYASIWVAIILGWSLASFETGETVRKYATQIDRETDGVEMFGYCHTDGSFDSGVGVYIIMAVAIIIVSAWAWETRKEYYAAANDSRQLA